MLCSGRAGARDRAARRRARHAPPLGLSCPGGCPASPVPRAALRPGRQRDLLRSRPVFAPVWRPEPAAPAEPPPPRAPRRPAARGDLQPRGIHGGRRRPLTRLLLRRGGLCGHGRGGGGGGRLSAPVVLSV